MPNASGQSDHPQQIPSWVPKEASAYLRHTEAGTPIRALAREAGVHASTVLRQVRALEARREDVLVDKALSRLGRRLAERDRPATAETALLSDADLAQEARRVLCRLCEPGTVLAVADDMDKAVVVRETESGEATRVAIVGRAAAEAMALTGWIGCDRPGRVSRYRITGAGRGALTRMLAEAENRAVGFAEAPARFEGCAPGSARALARSDAAPAAPARRQRFQAAETPLTLLARRRDRRGQRFLPDALVAAGERLREDYEMADLGRAPEENWDRFLSAAEDAAPVPDRPGIAAARRRVIGALRDLGPGLGDVALSCCCHLEGLESAERRLGWSARSGKVVLRIALQRLRRHYDGLGEEGALLG